MRVGNAETQNIGVKKPDGPQDHPQIVSGTTKYGIQGIPEAALEPIPTQLAFILHVTDSRLDSAPSVYGFPD